MTSAYPIDLDTLTERVRAMAAEQGGLPSKRGVMTAFKVGRPKATAALAAIAAAGFTPAPADPGDQPEARRLHVVTADEPTGTSTPEPAPGPEAEPPTAPDPVLVTDAAGALHAPVPMPSVVDAAPVTGPGAAPAALPVVEASTGGGESWRWRWPLLLIAAGAFAAIWGGWVGLGELTGFGPIRLLPGIVDSWVINTAITLPLGVEAYAAFALRVWLAPPAYLRLAVRARTFARHSAIGALVLGMTGQIAYHLMTAAGITTAPWWITAFVSALPVVVLGCGAALAHLTTHAHAHAHADADGNR